LQRLLDAVLGSDSTGGTTNGSSSWGFGGFSGAFTERGQFYANLWFFAYSWAIGGLSAIIVVASSDVADDPDRRGPSRFK